jgi:hypothetical protein
LTFAAAKAGAALDAELNEHRARNLWRSGGRGRARDYCNISSSVLAERAIAAAANRGETEGGFTSPTGAGSARVCRFAEIRSYRPGHAPGGAVALTSGATALPPIRPFPQRCPRMLNQSTSARAMAAIASTSCAGIMRCGVATIRGIGEGKTVAPKRYDENVQYERAFSPVRQSVRGSQGCPIPAGRYGRSARPPRPLEFPSGQIVKVTRLVAGQRATVLQLPASTRDHGGAKESTQASSAGRIEA